MLDSHRDIRGHRDWDIHRFLRFPRFSGLASITSCRCAVVVIFFVQRDHGSHSAINKCQAPFTPSRMLSQLRIRVPCHRPKSPRTPITSHVPVSLPRTLRNHSPTFPWKELYAQYVHDTNAVFLGLPEEHTYFQKEVGRITYLPTSSLTNAAAIVAWSTVFIGNESLLLALATGMQNVDMNRQNGPLIFVESSTGKADFSRWNRFQCSENLVPLSGIRASPPTIQPNWITAVIVCKGRLKNLQASLPAALRCGCQVILVDAACPEHCGQWAQDAFGRRVMVINYAGPFDRSKALNAGLQLVNTPLTMILDADVVLWPEEFTGILHVIRPGAFYCHRHTNGMQGWVLFPTGTAQYDTDFTGYGRRDCDFLYQLKTAGLTPQSISSKFASHIRHPAEARVAFYGLSETESFRLNNARMLAKWGHTCFEIGEPINQRPGNGRPRIRRMLRNNRC